MASVPLKVLATCGFRQLQHLRISIGHKSLRSLGCVLMRNVHQPNPFSVKSIQRTICSSVPSFAKKSEKGSLPGKPVARDDKQRMVNVDVGNNFQVMTKSLAEKLANERELKLVLIDETSDELPLYKLMTGKELHKERERLQELKKANKKKETKVLRLTSKISEHDLETKAKKVLEMVQKGHPVKVHIKISSQSSDGDKVALETFKHITNKTKEAATVEQAQKSGHEMVYVLKPINTEPTAKRKDVRLFTNEELKENQRNSDST